MRKSERLIALAGVLADMLDCDPPERTKLYGSEGPRLVQQFLLDTIDEIMLELAE